MINKPTIIISSLGRTGTNFFAVFFNSLLENSQAVHEPGRINTKKILSKDTFNTLKEYGFKHSVYNKIFSDLDLRVISKQRINKKISRGEAADKLILARQELIEKSASNFFIESSYHYYGLIDVLPQVFSKFKFIYIIRDPRDWVRSYINRQSLYHYSDIYYWLGKRVTPGDLGQSEEEKKWKNMDHFSKLCWAWNHLNTYAINSLEKTSHGKLFLFEDLFQESDRERNMSELINFTADIYGQEISDQTEKIQSLLASKVNKSLDKAFPKWPTWSRDQAQTLNKYCGELMEKLGYGHEEAWQKMIK